MNKRPCGAQPGLICKESGDPDLAGIFAGVPNLEGSSEIPAHPSARNTGA